MRLGKFSSSTRQPPALQPLRAAFSPHCSSPSTRMTCTSNDPLCQAPEVCRRHHTDRPSFRTVTSLPTNRRLRSWLVWCSLNNLELKHAQTVEMIVDFRRNPPLLSPTHHHEQHGDCSGVIQHHHLPGPEVGTIHIDSIVRKAQQRLYFLRQLRDV